MFLVFVYALHIYNMCIFAEQLNFYDMNRIKELIKERGYTQQELADKMEMTRVGLNQLVNGNPSYPTLERFARVLNVPMWELFATRDEVIGEELTALVYHKGAHYRATTLEELRGIVEELERATAEATSAETSGRSGGR